MPTKQIKVIYQCESQPGESTTMTIAIDGVQSWSGALTDTGSIQNGNPDAPTNFLIFDHDIANSIANTTPDMDIVSQNVSITVSGGNALVEELLNNYVFTRTEEEVSGNIVSTPVPGTATDYVVIDINSQPLWNGVAITERYDITKNYGITGPGDVIINDNETVTFDANMIKYNDQWPRPEA